MVSKILSIYQNFISHLSSRKALSLFFVAIGASALILAYISQYVFGLQPCELCFWQRYPYMVMIVTGILAFLVSDKCKRSWLFLSIISLLLLLIDAGIAFYHMGVEYKWFEGLQGCSDASGLSGSIADMIAQMEATPAVPCDTPQFVFLLSMAGWNMVYALFFAAISLYLMGQIYQKECSHDGSKNKTQ